MTLRATAPGRRRRPDRARRGHRPDPSPAAGATSRSARRPQPVVRRYPSWPGTTAGCQCNTWVAWSETAPAGRSELVPSWRARPWLRRRPTPRASAPPAARPASGCCPSSTSSAPFTIGALADRRPLLAADDGRPWPGAVRARLGEKAPNPARRPLQPGRADRGRARPNPRLRRPALSAPPWSAERAAGRPLHDEQDLADGRRRAPGPARNPPTTRRKPVTTTSTHRRHRSRRRRPSILQQPRAVWAVAFACVIAFMGIGLVDPILKPIADQLDATPEPGVAAVHQLHGRHGRRDARHRLGLQPDRRQAHPAHRPGADHRLLRARRARRTAIGAIVGFRAGWGLGNALFIATALATIVVVGQRLGRAGDHPVRGRARPRHRRRPARRRPARLDLLARRRSSASPS